MVTFSLAASPAALAASTAVPAASLAASTAAPAVSLACAAASVTAWPAVAAWVARVETIPGFLPVYADAATEVVAFRDWFGLA